MSTEHIHTDPLTRALFSDRNWLEFLSVLGATFWDVTSVSEPSSEAQDVCRHHISKTKEFFAEIADKDGTHDRSGPLALLELEKRCVAHGLATGLYSDTDPP